MANIGKRVVLGILRLIQFIVFTVVTTLEYLADKKMGVMRYLVFKNAYYEQIYLKSQLVIPYKSVLIIVLIAALVGLLYSFIKKKERQITVSLISIMLINLAIYIFIFFKDVFRLKAYYLFLIAFLAALVIEFLRLIINLASMNFDKKNYEKER